MSYPDWIFNTFLVLFVICSTCSIIMFVGWLTHAGYYYKLIKNDEWELLSGIHNSINLVSALGAGLAYGINQSELMIVSLGISALYITAFILFYGMFYLFERIAQIRKYFANKRGINNE